MTRSAVSMLNSHHVIKCVALVIMTVDHLGAFLLPEAHWLRAIGRITFPVWFFLVGHALQYQSSRSLIVWALGMAAINPLLGMALFPLNALVTIILCQQCLQLNARYRILDKDYGAFLLGCVLVMPFSDRIVEYGTMGLLFAFMGHMKRDGVLLQHKGVILSCAAYLGFIAMQLYFFSFTTLQAVWIVVMTAVVVLFLARFEHRPVFVPKMLTWLEKPTVWLSRHSLQYYVIHRLVFQAIGLSIGTLPSTIRWF